MFTKLIGTASAAIIAGLLTVPVIRGDDLPPVTKHDLETSEKRLKLIGLASQEYHDVNMGLPVNICMKDGTPLLSWRVAILPYIDEKSLYEQFKLDEPWDSKHNMALVPKMPKLYEPIRVKAKSGETFYQQFEGEDALIRPKKIGYSMEFLTTVNGTSNTGIVYEAGTPVIWSKPSDLLFDKKKPLPKFGGMFDGEFHVLFCDGHVSLFRKNPDEVLMKYVIMPTNTTVFDGSKLLKPPPGKS